MLIRTSGFRILILMVVAVLLNSCGGGGGGGDYKFENSTDDDTFYQVGINSDNLATSQSGDVSIHYELRSPSDNSSSSIIAQYRIGNGIFQTATSNSKVDGLRSIFNGAGHQFIWQSRRDGVGLLGVKTVQFKLTTSSEVSLSPFFQVDNVYNIIIVVDPSTQTAVEDGDLAQYTVKLNRAPQVDRIVSVVVVPSAEAEAEVIVNPTVVNFTSMDWDTPKTVEVQAIDDTDIEELESVLLYHDISSTDAGFGAVQETELESVEIFIEDNDFVRIIIETPTAVEGGAPGRYSIVLVKAPIEDVIIAISGDVQSDLGSGSNVDISLTFTPDNWETPQDVVVTAVDDRLAPASDTPQTVLSHTTFSVDPVFDGLTNIAQVTIAITDND